MGLQADSAYDPELYNALAEAPLMLVDARRQATGEHATFEEVEELGEAGRCVCCVRVHVCARTSACVHVFVCVHPIFLDEGSTVCSIKTQQQT